MGTFSLSSQLGMQAATAANGGASADEGVSAVAVARNSAALNERRVLVSMVAGVCAGTLNVQSWHGLVLYLAAHLVFGALQLAVLRDRVRHHFTSVQALFT